MLQRPPTPEAIDPTELSSEDRNAGTPPAQESRPVPSAAPATPVHIVFYYTQYPRAPYSRAVDGDGGNSRRRPRRRATRHAAVSCRLMRVWGIFDCLALWRVPVTILLAHAQRGRPNEVSPPAALLVAASVLARPCALVRARWAATGETLVAQALVRARAWCARAPLLRARASTARRREARRRRRPRARGGRACSRWA